MWAHPGPVVAGRVSRVVMIGKAWALVLEGGAAAHAGPVEGGPAGTQASRVAAQEDFVLKGE
ncbi:hypothetical protein N867_07425 [Actinotalea fermentans ATCC 43279 = JCM 9966 = DSM 3133]|uniref:Uncharacterized protein n=1 Tax=Actinotalea fermentans TaxID=43671 RepID=A0A511Z184_9CELL|nr:hypothetical protein N867_07425 [Actinotalea fermentans ATCC 43279 = JCM 9966 = DSM 3133]GEN81215.1 hypothetical protein AFE02nite_29490 [Actinotalea fermentans]